MSEKLEKILKKYAKVITSESLPPPRFGHTVNLISKTSIVIFGGAICTPGTYTMTADLYLYTIPTNQWRKLETSSVGHNPHSRAAHASATVRENQLLIYGGSIGNGQYAPDDLWFLDIKNNEDASWLKVPTEGKTPGPRYGHSMVYIQPYLILFGGSNGNVNQRNEIMNDIWVFATDQSPFEWHKVNTKNSPSARLYHSACIYDKSNGNGEAMILFGGRDARNDSLKDLMLLKKERSEYEWVPITSSSNNVMPLERHQQCATNFGPFLMVVGGRAGTNQQAKEATFDVFSFISKQWFRFGSLGLFRHSVWVYFNAISMDNIELFLYIYGGFDSDNNSQINSNLYRIDLIEVFCKYDTLKAELSDYLKILNKKSSHSSNHHNKQNSTTNNEDNKNHFELNNKVVVYNIPEENNFSTLIKEISYSKLTEVDKKIKDSPNEAPKSSKRKSSYNEDIIKQFLTLLPNPEEDFTPFGNQSLSFGWSADTVLQLLSECKNQLSKTDTVIKLKSPVKIYGNINGQYNDLIRYFMLFGRPSEYKGDIECMDYLFLGNIVNRGSFSLEVLCLLFALKVKYTNNFHILRGSQEDEEICKNYGLKEECKKKFNDNNDSKVYKKICELFEYLPLAAVVNNQILCVHSGIGEHTKSISDINIKKPYTVKDNVVAQEILWATPGSVDEFPYKNCTAKYRKKCFGEGMVKQFLSNNKLKMIIRSHDVSDSGIEKMFNDKVISIFSATNYCGVYQNTGGILFIKKSYEIQPKLLTCEDNYSVWWKEWEKTDYPPSPKRKNK